MSTKSLIAYAGATGAVLAAILSWQALGLPFPASVAQVQSVEKSLTREIDQVQSYAFGNRLLFLYAELDRLRYNRDQAEREENFDLARELDRRIAEIERDIVAIRAAG